MRVRILSQLLLFKREPLSKPHRQTARRVIELPVSDKGLEMPLRHSIAIAIAIALAAGVDRDGCSFSLAFLIFGSGLIFWGMRLGRVQAPSRIFFTAMSWAWGKVNRRRDRSQ